MRRLFLLLLLALPMCQPPEAKPRHFPLPVDESRSMLARWAQKEVLASVVVDDMEQEGRWKVRAGKPELVYTRENCKDGTQALRQRVSLVDREHLAAERTLWNTFCGEQGGEGKSVAFCHKMGLNYVSCSPFRVPIARLAAAQAAIESAK